MNDDEKELKLTGNPEVDFRIREAARREREDEEEEAYEQHRKDWPTCHGPRQR